METATHMWEEICTGCLSQGRRITHLTGAAAEIFNEMVVAAGGLLGGAVCWECKARVHNALGFKAIVTTAVRSLTSCQLNKETYLTSLSSLSCHTANNVIYATCGTVVASEWPEQSPLFVKMEDDLDNYMDDALEFHEGLENDVKTVLKSETDHEKKRRKKKTKKTRKNKNQEFVESDDEPLASKMGPSDGDKSEGKRQGRGRKEGASGVVLNARVTAKLARLGLTPGSLDMVVLSWEEVEAERQRALSSENYLRHEHRCERCVLGFNHHLKLERHMEKHSISAGEFECGVCGVRCRALHALAAHRRRHRVRWRCGACGALWSRAAVAADHLRRVHAPAGGGGAAPAHACPACPHKAPTLNKLRAHMRSHAARQTCAECGKGFRDRNALRTHLFSHRADKEHACERCPARFLYPRALRLHRLTHDPPAPFYCHQCDVTFKNPMSYYQHMKYSLKHVHPDKLKHACEQCPARFVRAARLADHVAARHSLHTPHRCDFEGCNYRCASRSVLRAHARAAHAAPRAPRPRRLVCHACGHTYTTKKSLERHLRTHSNSGLPSRTVQSKRAHSPITDTSQTDVRLYVAQTIESNCKTVQKEA